MEKEKMMDDLISRQAAIDALQKEINKGIPPFDDVIGSIRCGVRLARNIIEDLPSAQPELLKCKDCYWWTKQEDSMQGRCERYKFYPTGYWYCAGARERRTDG